MREWWPVTSGTQVMLVWAASYDQARAISQEHLIHPPFRAGGYAEPMIRKATEDEARRWQAARAQVKVMPKNRARVKELVRGTTRWEPPAYRPNPSWRDYRQAVLR